MKSATSDSNDLDLRTENGLRTAWVAHSAGLRAVARRSLHDRERAEDAVQETFLRAWRKASHFDGSRGSVGTWLYAIMRNLLVDIARADAARPRTQPIVADVAANDTVDEVLAALTLDRALRLLSVQHRQVIVESYVSQHPHDQIARRLGVPIGTVRSRLHYARAALGKALRDVGAIDAPLPAEEPTMISKARRVELAIDPDNIEADYDRGGYGALSDAQLFDVAARVIANPKRGDASSFILHAPLELMARRLLLSLVAPDRRRAVRERMLWVAATYERAGAPVDDPRACAFASVDDARRTLIDAVRQGDLDTVDASASWFLDVATLDDVMALAAPTLDMLGAAGHAPIGFFLSSRLAATSRSALVLLRPLLYELARIPQLRIKWVEKLEDSPPAAGDVTSFISALARTPRIGLPGSQFIFPIVHRVDELGLARDLIGGALPERVSDASIATLRIAALSMLQDDPQFAQYGWTHCLTLPHAIVEILPWLSDQHRATAIATTYVVAFRATHGRADIDTRFVPERTRVRLLDALDAEPAIAAGAWYHAPNGALVDALPELVARAAIHEDAHLAKYTLACLAAAEHDVSARRLYLAAAASLSAWWATHPSPPGVPLA